MRDMVIKYFTDHKAGRVTIVLGALLFLIVLGIVLAIPCPTRTQYSVVRIALAAGISGMSLGFLVFIKDEKWALLKVAWMAGTFVLAYLANPASIVVTDDCQQRYNFIEGYVVLSGRPIEGVKLSLSEQDHKTITNNSGSFFLPYYHNREKTSRRIRVQWSDYDTLLDLSHAEPGKSLRIEIPREVSAPRPAHIKKLAHQRVEQCLEWIKAQHQGLMDTYEDAEEVTLNQLVRSCAGYEKTTTYQRNYYAFSNGIENIQHKKNLVGIGISPNNFKLESSFKLDFFKAFLFEKQTDLEDFHVSYGLLNRKNPEFKIVATRPQDNGSCLVDVEYSESIQYLFVSRNYTELQDKQRKRRMEFYGVKPLETLVLKRRNGVWEIDDVE